MKVHADLNAKITSMFFSQIFITTYKNQNKLCVFRITLKNYYNYLKLKLYLNYTILKAGTSCSWTIHQILVISASLKIVLRDQLKCIFVKPDPLDSQIVLI